MSGGRLPPWPAPRTSRRRRPFAASGMRSARGPWRRPAAPSARRRARWRRSPRSGWWASSSSDPNGRRPTRTSTPPGTSSWSWAPTGPSTTRCTARRASAGAPGCWPRSTPSCPRARSPCACPTAGGASCTRSARSSAWVTCSGRRPVAGATTSRWAASSSPRRCSSRGTMRPRKRSLEALAASAAGTYTWGAAVPARPVSTPKRTSVPCCGCP